MAQDGEGYLQWVVALSKKKQGGGLGHLAPTLGQSESPNRLTTTLNPQILHNIEINHSVVQDKN